MPRPTIQTDRLILRPFGPEDAPDVQRLAGEKVIAAKTQSLPHPYEDGMAEDWIASHEANYAAGKIVCFAVTERDGGALAGAVGLTVYKDSNAAELGYWIGTPFWGRGYATEAARAVLAFGFEEMGLHRIHARHMASNPASGRVLEKIGMKREGMRRQHFRKWGRFEDIVMYGRLKSDGPVPTP